MPAGQSEAGKSTLLKIMAGIDTDFTGDGWVAQGARVGYLPQEPQLDVTKSVRENVMEGVAEKQAMLEAADLKTRAEILIAVTQMELLRGSGPEPTMQ